MPAELTSVLEGEDEGSSSEDTSDEFYAARHSVCEQKERIDFSGFTGEAA